MTLYLLFCAINIHLYLVMFYPFYPLWCSSFLLTFLLFSSGNIFFLLVVCITGTVLSFYKMRKQHHRQNHHAPTRTVEIINVDDEITGDTPMESHLPMPAIEHEHLNHYNSYKSPFNHTTTVNTINSIHSSVHEPLLIRMNSKDNVQETQI